MSSQEESNYQNKLGKNLNYKEGERELTISIVKKKDGYEKGSMTIPMQWIKKLGIEAGEKNVIAVCKDDKIEIIKNNN